MFGKKVTFNTEVTNGTCPMCHEHTIFVSIFSQIYRCMTCGNDTEQKVNGIISFMPIGHNGLKVPEIKLMQDDGPEKT
jgi:uncharacterized protein (DUF983 family)